jgi:hypothetical protein
MPFLVLLLVLGLLLAPPARGAEPDGSMLPPPAARAEPRALTRAPLDERRPVELLAHGRGWVPLVARSDASSTRTAVGGGAGVGFRSSPYFSLGAEGAVLRVNTPGTLRATAFEVAAVGRVYLLETGTLDPYLELALGYTATSRVSAATAMLPHGPSARAGGGIDVVALSPLRVGLLLAYREVVEWAETSPTLERRPLVHGGMLAGVAVTLPLGQPL